MSIFSKLFGRPVDGEAVEWDEVMQKYIPARKGAATREGRYATSWGTSSSSGMIPVDLGLPADSRGGPAVRIADGVDRSAFED